ncbi:MAG: hypothetical protein DRJ43_05520 [Thermoprotei archaeon]|nr:MAG: hypothetical protein DRJ43_05520 [Thermoprotei archaeon]
MGEQSVKRGVPVLRTLLEIVKERKARAVRRAAEADDIFKGVSHAGEAFLMDIVEALLEGVQEEIKKSGQSMGADNYG